MDELERRISEVRPALGEPEWPEGHEQALRARVERTLSERRARRAPAVIGLFSAAAALVLWLRFDGNRSPRASDAALPPVESAAVMWPPFRFPDGSRADALSNDTRVETVTQSSGLVEARLSAGAARFDVVHDPRREFVVRAGDVKVSVLGTVFTVAYEGARVHVAVMVGKVRVDWGAGSATLLQDGEGVFPPPEESAAVPVPSAAAPAGKPSASVPERQRWVALAKAGDFSGAYARLQEAGPSGVADVPEELLLAADVSRRAGHIDRAAGHLERLLARYPHDSRASVAAFTLGRIRLQLGSPAAAGSAFEQSASSGGALAEDAMYRAIMAYRQAGDSVKAQRLQQRYFTRFPEGRYAAVLQKTP